MNEEKGVPNRSYTQSSFDPRIRERHRSGIVWRSLFLLSTTIGIIALTMLLYTIINQSFGYAAIGYEIPPSELLPDGIILDDLSKDELVALLRKSVSAGLFRRFQYDKPMQTRDRNEVVNLFIAHVIKPQILDTWSLQDSLLRRGEIERVVGEEYPEASLEFIAWPDAQFISSPQSPQPIQAGVRTAILGSIWIIFITILAAFPVGVSAAIYLEEYAGDNWMNRIIQTNINNLAGVPSIIYGMLGLAVFVRYLHPITSGLVFGAVDPSAANGRTILSAGLTLALLILPLVIINAQEAIRAVPSSLRWASYGLGGTKWQTVWNHVIPSAIPGILTGTIIAISRAFGETAPLVVVGAATYLTFDPSGPFSKFTTLPIQIYQWTTRPQGEFRHLAAAAILVLLVLLLSMNSVAVFLRNYFRRRNG